MARRKTKDAWRQEHLEFLGLVGEQKPALEIMETLNLTMVQLRSHILRAYEDQTLRAGDWNPPYEIIKLSAFPKKIREMLSKHSGENDLGGLVKVETKEDTLVLSLCANLNPQQPAQQTVADFQGDEEDISEEVPSHQDLASSQGADKEISELESGIISDSNA